MTVVEAVETGRLTQAEVRALASIAESGSYKAAAGVLSCSVETVKSHMKSARVKLGATNTTHAVAIAIRQGLI